MPAGYLDNDNVLWVKAHNIDGEEDITASAIAQIVNRTGVVIEADLVMVYTPERGRYEAQPDEDLWTAGQKYTAVINVVGSQNEEGQIYVPIYAKRRVSSG